MRKALGVLFILGLSLQMGCSTLESNPEVSDELTTANSERVTKGDVQARFNAFTTGGWAILLRNPDANGPSGFPFKGEIRPFPFFDGSRLCVDDWSLIVLSISEGGDKSFEMQEAREILDPTILTFTLDGEDLADTSRTPVKRFLNPGFFGFDEAYGFSEGRIFEPGEIPAGEHVLVTTFEHPLLGSEVLGPISFFVDPSDSPTCISSN